MGDHDFGRPTKRVRRQGTLAQMNLDIQTGIYTKLPQDPTTIRILSVIPDHDENADLECVLTLWDGVDEYEALSYSWGDEEPTSVMRVRQPSSMKTHAINIRPNLEAALKCLRPRGKNETPRHLWVDAICMNQEDTEEKNHQVPIMAEIYANASNVCVWLGKNEGDASLAYSFVKNVLNLADFDRLVKDERVLDEWAAFSHLMARPWFGRRWVIQEIAFAASATLHCGDLQMSWREFKDAVALFESAETDGRPITAMFRGSKKYNHHMDFLGDAKSIDACRLVTTTSNLFRRKDDKVLRRLSDLESLVSRLTSFKCKDPRDTIYAVISLASDTRASGQQSVFATPASIPSDHSEAPQLQNKIAANFLTKLTEGVKARQYPVDYDKTYFEVCKDFVEWSVNNSTPHSLDIICRPWAPHPSDYQAAGTKSLPSWITTLRADAFGRRPDDGHYIRINADSLVDRHLSNTYNAAKATAAVFKFRGRSLMVDGYILDDVKVVEGEAMGGIIPRKWPQFGGWEDRTKQPSEEFWRTLVADRAPDGGNPPSFYQRACHYAFSRGVPDRELNAEQVIMNGVASIGEKFLRRMQHVVWNRRLMRTKKRQLLGLAPPDTQEGDIVAILYGCSVPVVLRRLKKSERAYQLVGESYVYGMMDGEALDLQRWHLEKCEKEKLECPMRKQTFELM